VCWVVVGAAFAFGLLGILSIGIFVLPCALLATFYLARRNPSMRYMTGILSGVGVPLLVVAFLNRGGPAFVCSENTCEQQLSPWPWLLAGVLFVLLGPATYVLSATRRRNR
jgi:hypothetical protein